MNEFVEDKENGREILRSQIVCSSGRKIPHNSHPNPSLRHPQAAAHAATVAAASRPALSSASHRLGEGEKGSGLPEDQGSGEGGSSAKSLPPSLPIEGVIKGIPQWVGKGLIAGSFI